MNRGDGTLMYDVVIVGGGPAGLSAALMLGRCRRRVVICDAGHPRNERSQALHGYLTRDGVRPLDLLRMGREELKPYGVELRSATVSGACPADGGFETTIDGGERLRSRKLLIATGVVDQVPRVEGIDDCFGRSVFHCPYCDAWEVRDQPLAVYGRRRHGAGLALNLKTWSADIVLCSDGAASLAPKERTALDAQGIKVFTERIARLESTNGILERIVFRDGSAIERRAMFFSTSQHNRSDLASRLGCVFTHRGVVKTNNFGMAGVPGVFVAGDASRDVQWVIVAASEGAKVALAINRELQREEGHAFD
jgi:thioredoxin reductase